MNRYNETIVNEPMGLSMHARSYLRASTSEQDATRARDQVETFAAEHGLTLVGTYVENEFGRKARRPRTVPPDRR